MIGLGEIAFKSTGWLSVLAFNFMGDGLRDAADPYAR
jgi:hypothetical protein